MIGDIIKVLLESFATSLYRRSSSDRISRAISEGFGLYELGPLLAKPLAFAKRPKPEVLLNIPWVIDG